MGIFDRLRDAVGGDADPGRGSSGDLAGRGDGSADPGVDRGSGSGRAGTDDDRKTGSHGSHWDTLIRDNATVRESILATVEDGETREGIPVGGDRVTAHVHPTGGPIRTVAISVGGEVVTAYPVGDGSRREVTLDRVIPWANDVEAQLSFDCRGSRLAAFDTGYFFRGADSYDVGASYRTDLAAFVYDLEGVDDPDRGTRPDDFAEFLRFDGGDVDDYVFRTRLEGGTETTFAGNTVYRLQAPFFVADGETVTVTFYVADHATGGYRPTAGDDVEGVCWLQGRVV